MDNLILILKFGEKENLIKLKNGSIYAKNAKYYIGCDEEQGDKSRGDKYEFSQTLIGCKGMVIDKRTNTSILNFENGMVQIRDKQFEKTPMFCACGITLKDLKLIKEYDDKLIFELNFKEVFGNTFNQSYWDSVAMLSAGDFIDRLLISAKNNNVSHTEGMVKYYNHFNLIDKEIEVRRNFANVAFWKQSLYEKQKELRILFDNKEIEDNEGYTLNVGDLSDICTIIDREQIEDTIFYFEAKKIKK